MFRPILVFNEFVVIFPDYSFRTFLGTLKFLHFAFQYLHFTALYLAGCRPSWLSGRYQHIMAAAPPGAEGPRLSRAVVDLGGDILRDTLYYHYTPTMAHAEVMRLRLNHRHPLNKLNVQQMSVLNNASTKGDYSDCDITLLYSLLRNLPLTNTAMRPTTGWGTLPVNAANVTLGDDIERIRDMRNQIYGHIATTAISVVIYTQYMAELYNICLRMDTTNSASLRSPTPCSNTYCQTLSHIKVVCMDSATEKRYTEEIIRMEKSDKEIRDQIKEARHDLSSMSLEYIAISAFVILQINLWESH